MLLVILACQTDASPDTGAAPTEACLDDTTQSESALTLEGDPDCGAVAETPGETAGSDCGAVLFAADCAGCHGESGGGSDLGPALAGPVAMHSDAELLAMMVLGADGMPPVELTQQGYADVIAWLRLTFGEQEEGR